MEYFVWANFCCSRLDCGEPDWGSRLFNIRFNTSLYRTTACFETCAHLSCYLPTWKSHKDTSRDECLEEVRWFFSDSYRQARFLKRAFPLPLTLYPATTALATLQPPPLRSTLEMMPQAYMWQSVWLQHHNNLSLAIQSVDILG
jgi:hypothetical protein